jgi:hypothetical protein
MFDDAEAAEPSVRLMAPGPVLTRLYVFLVSPVVLIESENHD